MNFFCFIPLNLGAKYESEYIYRNWSYIKSFTDSIQIEPGLQQEIEHHGSKLWTLVTNSSIDQLGEIDVEFVDEIITNRGRLSNLKK